MPDARKAFHAELDALRADVVRLAGMVEEAITRATHILLDGDLAGAQELIEHDDVLDELTFDIEDRIYHMLALQQPILSGDLRVLLTALRLTADIERSGDLMTNVAKATRRIYGMELPPKVRGMIEQLGEQAQKIFRMAVDAYAEDDAAKARAIDDLDDVLDDLHRDYIAALFERQPSDRAELQCCVQLALVGRFYERVGDHAVNVAEWVQYLVTGSMKDRPHAHPTTA